MEAPSCLGLHRSGPSRHQRSLGKSPGASLLRHAISPLRSCSDSSFPRWRSAQADVSAPNRAHRQCRSPIVASRAVGHWGRRAAYVAGGDTMQWWEYVLLGAAGGALVELLSIFNCLALWQKARKTPTGRIRSKPPSLSVYLDFPAHAWMTFFRTLLGAGTAFAFGASGSINGFTAAVALGFSAPSLLAQLGNIPQIADVVGEPTSGGQTSSRSSVELTGGGANE